MKYCGDSFKICLIDDSSFEKIIPDWTIQMDGLRIHKKKSENISIIKITLYIWGFLPNSTIVVRDLRGLYDELLNDKDMFCGELINRSNTNVYTRFFKS